MNIITNIKKILGFYNNDYENIELIRNSKYFDANYYLLENPEVKGDPCKHYYYQGWKEGKSPSFDFSNNFYLNSYKDVEDAGINPLLHYLKFGKAENRLIEKDNGKSLKKIYEDIYNCPYFYKTYISPDNNKRINLFFDNINDNKDDLIELLKFVINFCEKCSYHLRIVYYLIDFDLFKNYLETNDIKLPNNTEFLKLKSSNYLEVGLNEKYICTSWQNARALINTSSINTNIYFYLNNLDDVSKEEYYQISNICSNDNVTLLIKDESILKKIRKCNLKFKSNSANLTEEKINQLYCDFDKMFIVGIELLNNAFLTGALTAEKWHVNIKENVGDFKFHFDTNVSIKKVDSKPEKTNLEFYMSYQKKDYSDNSVPTIVSWVEEEEFKKERYINIYKKDAVSKFSTSQEFSLSKINNNYSEFNSYLSSLMKEG